MCVMQWYKCVGIFAHIYMYLYIHKDSVVQMMSVRVLNVYLVNRLFLLKLVMV